MSVLMGRAGLKGRGEMKRKKNAYAIYCEESEGDSGPEDKDISAAWAENEELILPVEDRKGASRAMALSPDRYRHNPG